MLNIELSGRFIDRKESVKSALEQEGGKRGQICESVVIVIVNLLTNTVFVIIITVINHKNNNYVVMRFAALVIHTSFMENACFESVLAHFKHICILYV